MARQTGRTTEQMREAPMGAVFIWCNDQLEYPRELSRNHGRGDLMIVGLDFILSDRWRGMEFTGVVVDHAARLSDVQQAYLQEIKWRVR